MITYRIQGLNKDVRLTDEGDNKGNYSYEVRESSKNVISGER